MNFLNDLAAAFRQIPGSGLQNLPSSHSALTRVPGLSQAISSAEAVLGPLAGTQLLPNASGAQADLPDQSLQPNGVQDIAPRASAAMDAAVAARAPVAGTVVRAGRSEARWANGIVNAAMPALLRMQRLKDAGQLVGAQSRSYLALELRLFRERLAKAGQRTEVVEDASYLLCTYLDEAVNDAARRVDQLPYQGERSLLVEFHGDAWGGEDAFADLERWMAHAPLPVELLELYELILSLGWTGRYRVLDRGDVLLGDLRSQLHALLWHERSLAPLPSVSPIVVHRPRRRWWTALRLLLLGACVLCLCYALGLLDLDARGRPIREALAAWEPPTRTINLEETLPPPLPQLLAEGWLTAQKHPQGWLLIFRSDKAFNAGQAQFLPSFQPLVDKLGRAFAPWPGDMEIVGHTDAQPIRASGFSSNQALSEERAKVVAQALSQTAVTGGSRALPEAQPRQITWSGQGEASPVESGNTPAANEKNRRVEVLWKVAGLGPQRRKVGQP